MDGWDRFVSCDVAMEGFFRLLVLPGTFGFCRAIPAMGIYRVT
jgi:hypothetical protein